MGILHAGKGFMNAMTQIPPQIGDTIIAIVLYFAATSVMIERMLDGIKRRRSNKALEKAEQGEDD
jgi:simple sugar transport system permease protein